MIILRTFAPKMFPRTGLSFKLATQKGNDLLLPKRQKKEGGGEGVTDFVYGRTCPYTLYLKNWASLANKVIVSVSPKRLHSDL